MKLYHLPLTAFLPTPTQGTDLSMLEKLHKQHSGNTNYIKPKSSQVRSFGIAHFAGIVYYDAEGFLEKNRDTFSNDLFDLLSTTKSPFLKELFKNERAMVSQFGVSGLLSWFVKKISLVFAQLLHFAYSTNPKLFQQVLVNFASFRIPRPPYLGNIWLVHAIGCNVKCPTAPTINFPDTGPGDSIERRQNRQ